MSRRVYHFTFPKRSVTEWEDWTKGDDTFRILTNWKWYSIDIYSDDDNFDPEVIASNENGEWEETEWSFNTSRDGEVSYWSEDSSLSEKYEETAPYDIEETLADDGFEITDGDLEVETDGFPLIYEGVSEEEAA